MTIAHICGPFYRCDACKKKDAEALQWLKDNRMIFQEKDKAPNLSNSADAPGSATTQELFDCIEYAKHYHVNRGDGTDICKECGHDLRHVIHKRFGE